MVPNTIDPQMVPTALILRGVQKCVPHSHERIAKHITTAVLVEVGLVAVVVIKMMIMIYIITVNTDKEIIILTILIYLFHQRSAQLRWINILCVSYYPVSY